MKNWVYISLFLALCACSTTKKLSEGEVLYTGVKKIEIKTPKKLKLEGNQKSAITSPLSVAPNNPLFAPYYRTFLPTGLWVYNWNIKREKGLKWWLYKNLSKEPVLISDVQPELRLMMVENNLKDLGFFTMETDYKVLYKKNNPKKAKVHYTVRLNEPFHYNSIELWQWPEKMDSLVRRSMPFTLLKQGERYDLNILEEERQRISDVLRNAGYYYFNNDYIEYLADTSGGSNTVNLRIALKEGTPEAALHVYRVKNIQISLGEVKEGEKRDTLRYDQLQLDYAPPSFLQPDVVARSIKMRPGEIYNMRRQEQSRRNFIQLGVFRYANFSVTPFDTVTSRELDFKAVTDYTLPIETSVEVDVASKSNNLLGPGLILSVTNRNFRKRAEIFSFQLTGAYEWQVGGSKNVDNSLINSYELGVNLNLSIPRLVLPAFLYKDRGAQEQTQFQVGTDFLNRNGFFRMISLWGSMTYNYTPSRRHSHTLVPLKLNYTHLLRTSHEFDSTLSQNPAIELSFRDQFIPSLSYTYTYDRGITYRNPNRLIWKSSIMEAGNVTSGLFNLFGQTGEGKEILGSRYSQFLKLTSELIKYKQVSEKSMLVMRLMGGIGYAYGNTKVMPYSEQFYTGGSNSIRAFQVRSLGPGSYHPAEKSITSYLDQTGDIKLEGNLEYRFTISGNLKGALFGDAGNVWLLRKEEKRPGGEFNLKELLDEVALGTGFGLRYDITYIAIRLDLGVALHAPYDTGKSGYFNIKNYGFKDGLVLNIAIGYPF
ncbi:BamA/TamA family outer membrane protein [Odoribacter sp. OttesenSCG-928-G04]|nr:BamA/TamA family outer membrane protein [Odoribacter sp. OttesenSCG-928-G04]MDL2331016.1 BamA/TamA family outer membrane protein [Odoribacter sp. OttesenSCG-928-A06]